MNAYQLLALLTHISESIYSSASVHNLQTITLIEIQKGKIYNFNPQISGISTLLRQPTPSSPTWLLLSTKRNIKNETEVPARCHLCLLLRLGRNCEWRLRRA